VKSIDLVLKGYAKREDDVWVAVCLNYSLASQGNTVEEAMEKLMHQVQEYVFDAVAGDDKEHVKYLLTRSAPTSQWATFYWFKTLAKLNIAKEGFTQLFYRPVPFPLAP